MDRRRILFVCLGNICRSPLGEGILRHKAGLRGLSGLVETASAGTGGWHAGDAPDPRSISVAAAHGIDISGQRARQLVLDDFHHHDLVFAMDRNNLRHLVKLAPHDSSADIHLFMDFVSGASRDVPDPYTGGEAEFAEVFDMIAKGCDDLLDILFGRSERGRTTG